jgi:pyruvate/2-oxoglutarate dehydrogenase complex dihydrolipoamide acyltransferase (E2) component
MRVNMKLARVGMSMQEAVIARWCKPVGESFEAGEALYEIETEKVTQEVAATADGRMLEVFVQAGDTVPVGAVVCAVELVTPKPG